MYSERRVQELMRKLENCGLLERVAADVGRGKTIHYRINLEAGVFRERPGKGAKISPFSRATVFRKGAMGCEKGEIAAAPESVEPKTSNLSPLPPEGGAVEIWRQVSFVLKDDLSSAYVRTPHFQESAYDKYFRDAWLVEICGEVAILDSSEPELLGEAVKKFQKRLRETFRKLGHDISLVGTRSAWATEVTE